jgi:hypothetical protein
VYAPVVVVGICGMGTLIWRLFSIFVGEASWCNWTVGMGEMCVCSAWCGHRILNSGHPSAQGFRAHKQLRRWFKLTHSTADAPE